MTDEELDEKLTERQGAASIRDELQTRIDEISTEIKTELKGRGLRVVDRGVWRAQIVEQNRTTLSKIKLLSAGVSVAQIEAATETTPVEQLRVGPRPMVPA